MNGSWVEPPPQQKGPGCFGQACLLLSAFLVLLIIAFGTGAYFAVRYLKSDYFPSSRVALPEPTATQEEQAAAKARWDEFEKAARAHRTAHLEMTADELNALIASDSQLRGKALVAIENDVARVRLSVPLEFVRWLRGRYLNAECTVQSADNGDPADIHITNIRINDKPVDDEAVYWRFPFSLRHYIEDWTAQTQLKSFEIDDGRVILDTKGEQ